MADTVFKQMGNIVGNKLTNLKAELVGLINGKVDLTGGTMTGAITSLQTAGSITEAVAVMASDVLEPDNGTIQTRTLIANTTLTDGLANGQSMTLIVTSGGFTLTFPTTTFWAGSAPTLQTTDRLFLEKIGGVLYCSHTGSI